MTENTSKIVKSALKLKPYERLFIVDSIMQSLSIPDKKVDKVWSEEIESRVDALLSGKVSIIEWETK